MRLLKSPYRLPGIGDICFVTNADRDDEYLRLTRDHFQPDSAICLCLSAVNAGEQFIDLGANLGHYTLPLGKKGARVLAVEAMPETAQLLDLAIRESNIVQATVVHAAVTDRIGIAAMSFGSAWAQVDRTGRGVKVPATTLPRLAEEHGFDRPRLIKIDTEGSEFDILSSSVDWLNTQQQCDLLVEFNSWTWHLFGHSVSEGMDILVALGYRLFMLYGDTLIPKLPGAFLENCVADIFATRAPMSGTINGLRVATLSTEESLAILRSQMNETVHHRRHVASVLAAHWPTFFACTGTAQMAHALLADPHELMVDVAGRLRVAMAN